MKMSTSAIGQEDVAFNSCQELEDFHFLCEWESVFSGFNVVSIHQYCSRALMRVLNRDQFWLLHLNILPGTLLY